MSRLAKLRVLKPELDNSDTEPLSAMDRRMERSPFSWKTGVIAVVAIALLGLAGFAYQEYGLNRTLRIDSGRLTIVPVEQGIFQEYIFVSGNIVPTQTIYLDAIQGGQVTGIDVEEGAMVAAGQSLVTLKNINLQLEVVASEARLTEQINNLNTAHLAFEQNRLNHRRERIQIAQQIDELQRQLDRQRPLVGSGATSRATLEDLEAKLGFLRQTQEIVSEAEAVDNALQGQQMSQLDAAVKRISSSLDLARESLNNLAITAPISGQLTVFDVHLGESKAPGERIGQIDDISGFKVSAFIDEFYLSRVVIGQMATAETVGASYDLRVTKIYPNVQNRQFQVDFEFDAEPPANIRRGQTLRMKLDLGAETESLLLPNGSFINETGGQWVFVVDPDGNMAERRNVQLGRLNPNWVEVTGGLGAGEQVITSSYSRLADFDRINLQQQ